MRSGRWLVAMLPALSCLAAPASALADDAPHRAELRVDGCAADWAAPGRLLPVLRVELSELEVGGVGCRDAEAACFRVELVACDRAEMLRLSISVRGRIASRQVDLAETQPEARTRTLGLLLSDLWLELTRDAVIDRLG